MSSAGLGFFNWFSLLLTLFYFTCCPLHPFLFIIYLTVTFICLFNVGFLGVAFSTRPIPVLLQPFGLTVLTVPARRNHTWKPSCFGCEFPSLHLETCLGVGDVGKEPHFLEHLLLVKL